MVVLIEYYIFVPLLSGLTNVHMNIEAMMRHTKHVQFSTFHRDHVNSRKSLGGGGVNPLSFTLESLETFFDTYFSDNFFLSILTIFRLVKGEGPGEKHIFQLTFNPTGRMQTRTWRRANCAKPPVFSSLDISSRAVTRRGILSPTRW